MNAKPLSDEELREVEAQDKGLFGFLGCHEAMAIPRLIATIRSLQAELSSRMIPYEGTVT